MSRLLQRKETSLSQQPLEKIFSAQRTITELRNITQSTMKRVTVDNEKSTIFSDKQTMIAIRNLTVDKNWRKTFMTIWRADYYTTKKYHQVADH